ncbi:MAG: hypothetical protein H0V92_10635 [Pseudonocardiales bacterium]|nr:hypothetical protein [Pseudonocardiales bacterium]
MNAHNTPMADGPGPTTGGSGLAVIETAMAGLAYLDSAPTASHVAVFEHLHLTLTDALAAIDGV